MTPSIGSPPATKRSRNEPLTVPPGARLIQRSLVQRLEMLLAHEGESCVCESFRRSWATIVSLLEQYQRAIMDASGLRPSCAKGCADCCCHWVEDVNSFEAEIIAWYLKERFGERIPGIIEACRRSNARLERLSELVEEKLKIVEQRQGKKVDAVDLLLASFYQLQEECPLLDKNECMVYLVRPITCRMYASFSDPLRCHPEYIHKGDIPTYLFDPEEEADGLIDRLHFKFMRFKGDTGLRSLLIKYLDSP
jgi:Fe-S-cluster containining protein